MLTDLEWEVNEVMLYVGKVSETLKKERETIISLTIDKMRLNSNLAFPQALKMIFSKAPEMSLPDLKNKTAKTVTLKKKIIELPNNPKPLLLKKRIILGKLF
jgi:hypothetical protein